MSDFNTSEVGPFVERTTIIRGFDNTSDLSLDVVISDTNPFYWILEGIDYTALSGGAGPVHFLAQIQGCTFFYNAQDVGAGLGVYASWRGALKLFGDSTFTVSLSATFAMEMSVIAWGRFVGSFSQLPL